MIYYARHVTQSPSGPNPIRRDATNRPIFKLKCQLVVFLCFVRFLLYVVTRVTRAILDHKLIVLISYTANW